MFSSYHRELKTIIEASCTNTIHTWEKLFLQLLLLKIRELFLQLLLLKICELFLIGHFLV